MLTAFLLAALQAPPPLVSSPQQSRPVVVSSPNWNDYRNYPALAAERDEEGAVGFSLAVNEKGQAGECRIVASSGSESLDAGTCTLAARMRFKPPLDANGKPIASVYENLVVWLLADPRPIGATWLDADLRFDGKTLTACTTRGEGPYVLLWRFLACSYAKGLILKPQFASGMPDSLRLSLRVTFRATSDLPPWPGGSVIARDETRFSINGEGNAANCTPERDGDTFSNDFRSQNRCGHFLTALYVEPPKLKETPPNGHYELRLIKP